MVRPLNKVYPEGVPLVDEDTRFRMKAWYWVVVVIGCLVVCAGVIYITLAKDAVDSSPPYLGTIWIKKMSVANNTAHTALHVELHVPPTVTVSPQGGTFVLSTKVNTTLTMRAEAVSLYNTSGPQLILIDFSSPIFSSLNETNNGETVMLLEGDLKMHVKPTKFRFIPSTEHHEKFECRFLFNGVKLDQTDRRLCHATTPESSSNLWH